MSQTFSRKSESPEPYIRLSSLRVWYQEEEPPVGLEFRSSTGLGETETPLLEDAHKVSHTLGQEHRSSLNWTYLSPGRSPGEAGVSCGSLGSKDTGGRGPRDY